MFSVLFQKLFVNKIKEDVRKKLIKDLDEIFDQKIMNSSLTAHLDDLSTEVKIIAKQIASQKEDRG